MIEKKRKRIILVIGIILCIIAFLLMQKFHLFLPCVFHEVTDLYCPGCGMTRAFLAILQLDFYQAIRYNLFSPIVFVAGIFLGGNVLYKWYEGKKSTILQKIPSLVWYSCLLILVSYGILRNIEYFSWLAPTTVS